MQLQVETHAAENFLSDDAAAILRTSGTQLANQFGFDPTVILETINQLPKAEYKVVSAAVHGREDREAKAHDDGGLEDDGVAQSKKQDHDATAIIGTRAILGTSAAILGTSRTKLVNQFGLEPAAILETINQLPKAEFMVVSEAVHGRKLFKHRMAGLWVARQKELWVARQKDLRKRHVHVMVTVSNVPYGGGRYAVISTQPKKQNRKTSKGTKRYEQITQCVHVLYFSCAANLI